LNLYFTEIVNHNSCCYNICSYFIKLLLEKKYALPYRVVDAVVAHFMRFFNETRIMPVIWHQSLLAFVQRSVINLLFLFFNARLIQFLESGFRDNSILQN